MAQMPKYIVSALRDALSAARMENARFGFPTDTVTYQGEEITMDAFIKEHVRNYLNSWVAHPIEKALAWAEPPSRDTTHNE